MPQLYFKIAADYEKVIRLRNEIQNLEKVIKSLPADMPQEEIQKLVNQLTESKKAFSDLTESAAKAGLELGNGLHANIMKVKESIVSFDGVINQHKNSLTQLKNELADAKERMRNLDPGTDEYARAVVEVDRLTAKMNQEKVTIDNLKSAQNDLRQQLKELNMETQKGEGFIEKLLGGTERYHTILNALPGPIKSVVAGIAGMTKAALAFIATPLGAVIAVLVTGYQALKQYVNSSAEGQERFAKVSGYVTGIVNTLKDVVIAYGKALFNMGGIVVDAFNLMSNIGNSESRQKYWEDIKRHFSEIGDAAGEAGDAVKNVFSNASDMGRINQQRQNLKMRVSEWESGPMRDMEEKIAKARARMYTGTDAERLAASKEIQSLYDEMYEQQKKFKQEELALLKEEHSLSKSTLEDKQAELRLEGEIKALETAKTTSAMMAIRRGSTAEDALSKEEQEMWNNLAELREKNQQRMIDLMDEGVDKEIAQIEANYKKEIESIRKLEEEWSAKGPLTEEQSRTISLGYGLADENRIKETERVTKKLLDQYKGYFQQREEIEKKYAADRKALQENGASAESLGELDYKQAQALEQIDSAFAARSEEFKSWAAQVTNMSIDQLETLLDQAQKELADMAENDPNISVARGKVIYLKDRLSGSRNQGNETKDKWQDTYKVLTQVNKEFKDIGKTVGGTIGEIIELAGTMATSTIKLIDGIQQIAKATMTATEETVEGVSRAISTAEKASVILAIISAALQVVTAVVSAITGGVDHMKVFREELSKLNHELDLARIYAMRDSEARDTILGTDRWYKAGQAINAATDALRRYNDVRNNILAAGNDPDRNFFSLLLGGSASADEAIKNMSVQIRHSTLFRSAIYTTLGEALPEMFNPDGSIDMTMLEKFVGSDTFERLSKENQKYLNDLLDYWKAYEESMDEVSSYLTDIFGELGNTITDAMADAFANGTDAAQAFTDSVSQMLETLAKNMIYSVTFAPLIQRAQEQMMATMKDTGLTDEQKFNSYVTILGGLQDDVIAQKDQSNILFQKFKEMASERGYDIFAKTDQSETSSSAGGFQSMSQDDASELNGRFTALQLAGESVREQSQLQTIALYQIRDALAEREDYMVADEIRTIIANSYLELQGIRENTEAVIKPIKNLSDKLDKWDDKIMRM